jgi:hypothetical protein
METLLTVIALLSSGLFAGAALYITAVEHPARISQGALTALQEFRPSYKRAAPLQASLAVICFLCSVVVWRLTGRWAWLAGGALVGAVVSCRPHVPESARIHCLARAVYSATVTRRRNRADEIKADKLALCNFQRLLLSPVLPTFALLALTRMVQTHFRLTESPLKTRKFKQKQELLPLLLPFAENGPLFFLPTEYFISRKNEHEYGQGDDSSKVEWQIPPPASGCQQKWTN